ncbi:ABC transporter permease [Pseudogracilibacillus auburnensis]|uniref:Fluoroquinolone transport system permease protein n=1 Tax=Pseudogracilibacillus auburnensis TaxID=1494959 RepID=A0A2V3W094_9BACI|nr:ABC transporter permease [Pseudogracilibacillus auburnensis]MBO1004026.1 ABC transporter permease [Pseudogracilibacillus auburnensis]PXW85685.1 fluoroquinolone transport system permease protein [Pseudogracilibacillus auburnensis]
MKIRGIFIHDVKFQFRQGFYFAYAILTIMLILVSLIFTESAKQIAVVILLITEITSFSSTFIAANLLLEKEQGVYDALFITPINVSIYLLIKIFSMSIPAVVSGALFLLFSLGTGSLTVWTLCGIYLTAILFILLGLAVSTRCKSMNGFILVSIPFGLLFAGFPLLEFLHIYAVPFSHFLPTHSTILLLRNAFEEVQWKSNILALLHLIIWIIIFWFWAKFWFTKYIVWKGGKMT